MEEEGLEAWHAYRVHNPASEGLWWAAECRSRGGPHQGARIIFEGANGPQSITLKGHQLWAMRQLVAAGRCGFMPGQYPSKWSAIVSSLRRHGLQIETVSTDKHGPSSVGGHQRYVLRTPVAIAGGAYV